MRPLSRPDLLEFAAEIGHEIAEVAVWHDGMCAFHGHTYHPTNAGTITYRSFDGALYDGSSGIALALARLFLATGEDRFRTTALGAMRHANSAGAPGAGLYDGWAGIALAAHCFAGMLESDEARSLASQTEARFLSRLEEPSSPEAFDLTSGTSGQIFALCELGRNGADRIDRAHMLGQELVSTATRRASGVSWGVSAAMVPTLANLCGLAHGASGPALAFTALADATGDETFGAHAAACRRYERSWYDAHQSTWPDLRSEACSHHGPSCAHYWCQGSVGVGLERLGARDPASQADAGAAVAGVLAEAQRVLSVPHGDEDFSLNGSLCHGLGGMIEFLALARNRAPETETVLQALAGVVHSRKVANGAWASGVIDGGGTPGLMTGLAGTALAFLVAAGSDGWGSASLPGYLRAA